MNTDKLLKIGGCWWCLWNKFCAHFYFAALLKTTANQSNCHLWFWVLTLFTANVFVFTYICTDTCVQGVILCCSTLSCGLPGSQLVPYAHVCVNAHTHAPTYSRLLWALWLVLVIVFSSDNLPVGNSPLQNVLLTIFLAKDKLLNKGHNYETKSVL